MLMNSKIFRIRMVQEKSEQMARPIMTIFTTHRASWNISQGFRWPAFWPPTRVGAVSSLAAGAGAAAAGAGAAAALASAAAGAGAAVCAKAGAAVISAIAPKSARMGVVRLV